MLLIYDCRKSREGEEGEEEGRKGDATLREMLRYAGSGFARPE